jgi:hypothetical protein
MTAVAHRERHSAGIQFRLHWNPPPLRHCVSDQDTEIACMTFGYSWRAWHIPITNRGPI